LAFGFGGAEGGFGVFEVFGVDGFEEGEDFGGDHGGEDFAAAADGDAFVAVAVAVEGFGEGVAGGGDVEGGHLVLRIEMYVLYRIVELSQRIICGRNVACAST
jgi:hypothetical protein